MFIHQETDGTLKLGQFETLIKALLSTVCTEHKEAEREREMSRTRKDQSDTRNQRREGSEGLPRGGLLSLEGDWPS